MSTVPQSVTEGAGHERKDADVPSIFLIGIGLLLLVLLVQLTIWMTLRHLRLERAAKDKSGSRAAEVTFPDPRLQVDPAADLAKMRARDSRELEGYRWVDRKAGTVRIPIERAMQLTAERGLPDVGQNQTPLSLVQARPAAKATPPKRRTRY